MESCKGAPEVVVLRPTALNELLELGHNHVIAALAGDRGPEVIVDLFSPVDGENCVGHLTVDVLDVLIIEEHTISCNCKAEALVVLLLNGTGVLHRLLYGIHGHQRLAAEEVHLDVTAVARLGDDEVDGPFGGLEVHGHAVAGAEIAGGGKAILTPQVAVVGDMEAQGLDQGLLLHGGSLLPVNVVVLLKKQPLGRQTAQLLPGLLQGGWVVLGQPGAKLRRAVLSHGGLHLLQKVVGELVQHVDGAAVDIHGDIHAKALKGMYHICSFLLYYGTEKGWVPHPFRALFVYYFLCSHFWLATVQEVLQADWQEVWHSPQPPWEALCFKVAPLSVLMWVIGYSLHSMILVCIIA